MNELLNRWLDENNLGKYKKVFDDNDVSFDLLDKLTEEDLRELSCLLYTSPSPRDRQKSRMPSSA